MLTQDQLTTIRAALRYWRDEIVPAGPPIAAHYYDVTVDRHLQADEIDRLIDQFQANKTRCVMLTPDDHVLAVRV